MTMTKMLLPLMPPFVASAVTKTPRAGVDGVVDVRSICLKVFVSLYSTGMCCLLLQGGGGDRYIVGILCKMFVVTNKLHVQCSYIHTCKILARMFKCSDIPLYTYVHTSVSSTNISKRDLLSVPKWS